MRIGKRVCETIAKDGSVLARQVSWDDELPGFGARKNQDGTISFVLKFRVKGQPKQHYVTLGEWPTVNPDRARDEATNIKTHARQGRDLLAERQCEATRLDQERRQEALRAIPVSELLDAWKATTEAEIEKKQGRGESVLYERELLRLEGKTLRPELGSEQVGSLDPDKFQALISHQPSVSTARNMRGLVVRFIKFANNNMVRRGIPTRWPVNFEVTGRSRSRDRFFSLTEAAQIWTSAKELGRRGALLQFMLLTGCRRREAQLVEYEHINLEDPMVGPHWTQPGRLTKNYQSHRVPLAEPAVALLRWLPKRATKSSGESELVFAGHGNKPVGGWTDVRRALMEGAKIENGTLHDFRRTMVSTLGDHGFDPQVADLLLNHSASRTMGGVMGVYQRSDLWLRRREAMDLWSRVLMEAINRNQVDQIASPDWGFVGEFVDARIKRVRAIKP